MYDSDRSSEVEGWGWGAGSGLGYGIQLRCIEKVPREKEPADSHSHC